MTLKRNLYLTESESFGTQILSSDEKKGNQTVGSSQVCPQLTGGPAQSTHTPSHTSVPSHISKSSSVKEQHLIKYQ